MTVIVVRRARCGPCGDNESEVVIAPPPERVQLRHDCVQAEQVVPAVLLCLQMNSLAQSLASENAYVELQDQWNGPYIFS